MDDALAAQVREWSHLTKSATEEVDAVVVGSGCGGAIVARELAQAGKRVLMLERGGFSLPRRGDFDQREDDMFARIDGGRGLDTTDTGQLALTYGRNVGGASVHYWADTWRTPTDRLERWASEFGVTGHSVEELTPYFERLERDLHVHAARPEKRNVMNQLFLEGAEKDGLPWEPVMQARDERCIGSGYCMQGCAYDGKQSQLVTTLPQALSFGARLYADCEVDHLVIEGDRVTGVVAQVLDRRTQAPSGVTLRVKAKKVIVAAGGFSSAPLLMRSKVVDPSGQLGKNLRANPCPQLFATFDRDVVMWRGIPAAVGTMSLRLPRFEGERYVEGGYLLYPNQLPPATLASLLPSFGREHRALMQNAHRLGSSIAWIDDQGSGSVRLDGYGDPVWSYELSPLDQRIVRDALKKEATVLFHAGAREVIVPDPQGTRLRGLEELARLETVDLRPGSMLFAAPHPGGMCRMGPDPARAVVDCENQHHQVKGLYVCDSSVFPTACSVDPSETIMAFSFVAARTMLEHW
jgi:choline dehydrogenase-like flavoprotein